MSTKLKSCYIKELKRYTLSELQSVLGMPSEKETIGYVEKLKEYNILKMIMADKGNKDLSDLTDADYETGPVQSGDAKHFYVSSYVGVIVFKGRVLRFYPKYLPVEGLDDLSAGNIKLIVDEVKRVIPVIRKYKNPRSQTLKIFNGYIDSSSKETPDNFELMMYLLDDYFESGLYSHTEEIYETNGPGDILWGRTIDSACPVIRRRRPLYLDLQTRRNVNDENNYFKRLHACILTTISKMLEEESILELLGYIPVNISDEELVSFADDDNNNFNYALYQLDNELCVQFNTRKQLLLKAMSLFLKNLKGNTANGILMYGTNSFNLVWEDVCSKILRNSLDRSLAELGLEAPGPHGASHDSGTEIAPNTRLKDVIGKPIWKLDGVEYASSTIIPDTIAVSGKSFIIYDAKYYTPSFDGNTISGQPGVESVVKQYMYQLAYKDLIEKNNLTVSNCFLLPTYGDTIVPVGDARLDFIQNIQLSGNMDRLAKLQVVYLPVKLAYNHYLSGVPLDETELGICSNPAPAIAAQAGDRADPGVLLN